MTVQEWLGKDNTLGIDIWERKYRNDNESFDDWLDRVSGKDPALRNLIEDKKFLFAGRINANRGIADGSKRTLSNCYVLSVEDNLESIFDCAKNMARTYSTGGGVGVDISPLAPKGAVVRNAAKCSSGAVSFMDLYSLVTGLIAQEGRRGALMLSMACNHPDIEEFIDVKSDLTRVTKANTSIRIFDDFMQAVKNNGDYELSFVREATGEKISKTIKVRELFRKMAFNNWDMGEPGMLFWDRVSNWNLMSEDKNFKYGGVNPCAEEPLPNGGACLLGSLNLSAFVDDAGMFNYADFAEAVSIATIGLNEILDEGMNAHPLESQRKTAHDWRQIGVGVFGIADMLIKMGLKYGEKDSLKVCDMIGHYMINYALRASAELAKRDGAYPMYKEDCVLKSDFLNANADDTTIQMIKLHGLRNSQLLTIPPCGSIATMIGVSSGIEPIYANYYTRKTESLNAGDTFYKVYTPIVKEYMREHNLTDDSQLPAYFVASHNISPESRIEMQSVWQKHIDASISSTVNLPSEATVEDVEKVYQLAWEKGLKGITVFRDGCRRAGILTTTEQSDKKEESSRKFDYITPVARSKFGTTHGSTYLQKCACGKLYITVNRDDAGNVVETFVHTSKGGICQANSNAVNRLISLAMRGGIKVNEIIEQLQGINCPACVKAKSKGQNIDGLSCPDIIANVIKNFYNGENPQIAKREVDVVAKEKGSTDGTKCPDCGSALAFEGGCATCKQCGWSKCG